jgi:hypothetical protein
VTRFAAAVASAAFVDVGCGGEQRQARCDAHGCAARKQTRT